MRAVIGAEGEIGLGKAVLDDLFYLFALREKATCGAGYLTAMTFEQLLESRFVARAGSGDQRIICPLCGWNHKRLPNLSYDEQMRYSPRSLSFAMPRLLPTNAVSGRQRQAHTNHE